MHDDTPCTRYKKACMASKRRSLSATSNSFCSIMRNCFFSVWDNELHFRRPKLKLKLKQNLTGSSLFTNKWWYSIFNSTSQISIGAELSQVMIKKNITIKFRFIYINFIQKLKYLGTRFYITWFFKPYASGIFSWCECTKLQHLFSTLLEIWFAALVIYHICICP